MKKCEYNLVLFCKKKTPQYNEVVILEMFVSCTLVSNTVKMHLHTYTTILSKENPSSSCKMIHCAASDFSWTLLY